MIAELPLSELRDKIARREITAEQTVTEALDNIRSGGEINAFITVFDDSAVRRAREIDAVIASGGNAGALAGIPVAIKDNIAVKGSPMTCASRFLEHFVAPYNATAVEKLLRAGAVIVGKTNMDEFAMGAANKNSAFGAVRNPLDPSRVPGGSSGGSAAAVAAGMCCAALGTDTGGSVRQPAAFCGITGLKPTYSSVSRYGLTAFASSLDQIGPLTRCAEDNALVYDVISGKDPRDSTSADAAAVLPYEARLKGRKVGVIRRAIEESFVSDRVRTAFFGALEDMKRAGAIITECEMPSFSAGIATYFIVSCAEAASTLSRFDGIRYGRRAEGGSYDEICSRSRAEGFGAEVKRRLMTGAFVLSEENYDRYYRKALKMRACIAFQLNRILKTCDFVVTPTAPTEALPFDYAPKDIKRRYYGDMFTVIANLAGNPSLSVPCGEDGLPAGLLFTGRMFDEKTLFSAASAFEKIRGGRAGGAK